MVRILTLLCITFSIFNGICQTEVSPQKFKNQLSTNLLLPFFGSVDLSYERTVANKWAVGVGGALYGNGFENLSTSDYSYGQETKYEITPFVRLYFNGAQKKSHFLEIFGSLSEVEEWGRYIRHVNEEGYGVYTIGAKTFIVGGLGVGYGYRFLFLEDKLVLEPQFGIRTNFDVDFIFLNGALVRTGIKVGYRF